MPTFYKLSGNIFINQLHTTSVLFCQRSYFFKLVFVLETQETRFLMAFI